MGEKKDEAFGERAQKQREHPVADTDCRCRCRCWLAARFPLRTHNLSCGQNVLLSGKRLARFRFLPSLLSYFLSPSFFFHCAFFAIYINWQRTC